MTIRNRPFRQLFARRAWNPCDSCKAEVTVEFTVDNAIWAEVTGHKPDEDGYGVGYLCIPCFIAKAQIAMGDKDFPIEIHLRGNYFRDYPYK